MFKFDLMNIFEGLIRNYIKFNLNKDSDKFSILKKEIDYLVSVGEVLGYSSIVTGIDKDNEFINNKIEIIWHDYDDKKAMPKDEVFYYSIEEDLVNDIKSLDNLFNNMNKETNNTSFMQVIEVVSKERILYLNRYMQMAKGLSGKDSLIVYRIKNILEGKTYLYAYLFNGNKIVKERVAVSYTDVFGFLKAKFID
ncbi:hypothetical protein [Clostridium septicum]|uniref:Uncharacterized protein n=1 Tax=Clostridium septicum TaxID=1504 RepID=A0A9N7JNR8_CLOSE|nr:hypothetical protein [Clostridium septicum]AYE35725.1 hypothetical protein CP523_15500 [Clostridium septicum]MDU1314925.1 hypothetical protein [Clostridium septicum]QAS61064.1 hypothetical protein EI377_10205 [Clostridium septicum]UEC19601.1 hypothetical protein LK444_09200 [Clostridium septicum]USS02340.1 hypothetical protein NH397_07980 [Clostridium septicum]